MKYRIFTVILLTLCSLGIIQAQDNTAEYRLRVPSTDEYLKALPDIIESQPRDDLNNPPYDFIDALENIFEQQYGSTATANELSQVYDLLNYGSSLYANYMPYLNLQGWNMSIVGRWFEENSTDFDLHPNVKFLSYSVDAQPYDFNGDGKSEWLLHIQREHNFSDYWVAWSDKSVKGGYRFESLPVPYEEGGFWAAQEEWGGAHLDRVEDLNADGKPELIFKSASVRPSSGMIAGVYRIYVIGWHKTGFEILTTHLNKNQEGQIRLQQTVPNVGTQGREFWSFKNIDDDAALEMLETARYEDNYGCIEQATAVYDWDGYAYYRLTQEEHIEESSVNCALRDAQVAMWHYQYPEAVAFYETALNRYWRLPASGQEHIPHIQQFAAYARERLVLAYALAGQLDKATALLGQMRREPSDPQNMVSQLLKVSEDGTTAFELCNAAYDYFDHYPQQFTHDFHMYRGLPDLNFVSTDYYGFTSAEEGPQPAKVGCDANPLASDLIETHPFTTDQSLHQQISQLGIEINKEIHADLNNDKLDDWVIWVKGDYRGFGFVSDGKSYHVAQDDYFPYYPKESNISNLTLPDGSGSIWLNLRASTTASCNLSTEGINKGIYEEMQIQELVVWAAVEGKIVNKQEIPVCEHPATDELFRNDLKLHAWKLSDVGNKISSISEFSPAVYIWNSEKQLYVLESPDITHTPQINSTPSKEIVQPQPMLYYRWELTEALWYRKDFSKTLEIVDVMLKNNTDIEAVELRFYRALALEALNRPDEALAEYVTIYQDAPESAWGKLAALHLECVANCGS